MATFSSTMLFIFAILLLVSKSKAPTVTGKPEDEPKTEADPTNRNNAQVILEEDKRWPSEIPGPATQPRESLQVDWNVKAKDLCSGLDKVTQSQKLAELEKCISELKEDETVHNCVEKLADAYYKENFLTTNFYENDEEKWENAQGLIGTYLYLFTQANLDPANFAESVPLNNILYKKGRQSAVNNPATPEEGNQASGDVNHENTQTS